MEVKDQIKKLIEDVNRQHAEFKDANDKRLAAIEKRGAADVVLEEKVARLSDSISQLDAIKGKLERIETELARVPAAGSATEAKAAQKVVEAKAAFEHFVRTGDGSKMAAHVEAKTLTVGTNSAGGFTVPTPIEQEIEKLVLELSPVRSLVTVKSNASPNYKKNVNTRGTASGWVGESGTRSATANSAYSQVSFTHGELYAYPEISRWLLESSQNDMNAELFGDVADELARAEGNAVVAGNGTDKPTGFLTGTPVSTADSSRAFGVLQYVAGGAASTFATTNPGDALISLCYAMKSIHRANGKWAMNKNTMGTIMRFKDGNGNYLWQPSYVAGAPSTIHGYPVVELPDMPDVAANAFPVAFGDFKRGYYMLDIAGMSMIRDDVTNPGFIKFYVHKRLGGKLVNSEAIKLIKIATS